MKIKNNIKVLFVMVLIFIMTGLFVNNSYATYTTQMKNAITGTGDKDNPTTASKGVSKVIGSIMTILRIVAITVAVLMLLACAMKYMSAAPGEKAEMKKSMIAYVIGAVVIFAATGILSIIASFAEVVK